MGVIRDEMMEFLLEACPPGGQLRSHATCKEYPPQIKLTKTYRVEPPRVELTQLECGCWYQQRGLYLVRFRACDAHSLETGDRRV